MWEKSLSENPKEFFERIKDYIQSSLESLKGKTLIRFESKKEVLGVCPGCGGQILENTKAYYCSEWKSGCTFTIWKSISGVKLSRTDVIKIISGKETAVKKFKNRAGKVFTASLKLTAEKKIGFIF